MENKQYHNQLRCNIYIYIYIIKADIDNKNTHTRNIKFKRRIQINKENTSYILLNKRNNARRRDGKKRCERNEHENDGMMRHAARRRSGRRVRNQKRRGDIARSDHDIRP